MRQLFGLLISASLVTAQPGGATVEARSIRIAALRGDGAFNDITRRVAQDIAVMVKDENDQPVQGATVVFTLPYSGAGGTFSNGERAFTVATDAEGVAAVSGMRPNRIEGRFSVHVRARFQGLEASGVVAQSNTLAGPEKGSSKKKFVLFGLLGGAAAGGILVMTRGGGSGQAARVPTSISIGSVGVGGPR
jgi:hypothetical protein